jgi:hypothetical protein
LYQSIHGFWTGLYQHSSKYHRIVKVTWRVFSQLNVWFLFWYAINMFIAHFMFYVCIVHVHISDVLYINDVIIILTLYIEFTYFYFHFCWVVMHILNTHTHIYILIIKNSMLDESWLIVVFYLQYNCVQLFAIMALIYGFNVILLFV